MPYMDHVNHDRIPYFNDSRFAYFKFSHHRVEDEVAAGATGSVQERVSLDQVRAFILDGLSGRTCGALQLSSVDELNLTTPLIDQGVDSLSAVTVSSWFSKNLSIDISLLKIIGDIFVYDMIDEAVSHLAPKAIPLTYSELLKVTAQPAAEL